MDYAKESLRLHGEWKGKIEMVTRVPVKTKDDLSLAYTPGVAQPCLEIQKDINKSYELTRRWNMAAGITDGSALTTIPLETDLKLHLGYVTADNRELSVMGERFVSHLKRSLDLYANR